MPVTDRCRLTSGFGKRNIQFGPNDHWGLDFGGPEPGTSVFVKAAAAGVVVWIKHIQFRSGPCIGIKHPDGTLTNYVHTRRYKVRIGQQVERGEVIAESWHTGIRIEAGIHLHFEWWADANDHRSVFDPTERLADYGWTLKWDAKAKKYRMYDEWEGRAHATPAASIDFHSAPVKAAPAEAPQEAPQPEKDWFDMATEADLRKIVREELDKPRPIDATKTIVYWVNPATGKQERTTLTRLLQTEVGISVEIAQVEGVSAEKIDEIHKVAVGNPAEEEGAK
jgi:hypothetical protein